MTPRVPFFLEDLEYGPEDQIFAGVFGCTTSHERYDFAPVAELSIKRLRFLCFLKKRLVVLILNLSFEPFVVSIS